MSCLRTDIDAVVDEIARKEALITQSKLTQVRNLVISILTDLYSVRGRIKRHGGSFVIQPRVTDSSGSTDSSRSCLCRLCYSVTLSPVTARTRHGRVWVVCVSV